jgi:ribosomal small subunit protein bTHX
MGKGDKKTKRGKLFKGSFGVSRRHNKPKNTNPSVSAEKKVIEVKEAVVPEKEIKEIKAKEPAKKAPVAAKPKAPAAAKKEPKAKKAE